MNPLAGMASDRHVAFFLPSLEVGGAERNTLNLCQSFLEAGARVDLVVKKAFGDLKNEIPTGVRLLDLQADRMIASLPKLCTYLREAQPEVLFSMLELPNLVAILSKQLTLSRTRIVIGVRTTVSLQQAVLLNKNLERLIFSLVLPRADGVVAVSNDAAEDFSRYTHIPRKRIITVYNPVITKRMLALKEQPFSHPWFSPGEPPVILAVGRLNESKDFPLLLRAFAALRKQRECRLVILGEGEKRSELERWIRSLDLSENVLLPGYSDNPYVWMRRANLFVLSSRREGLSTVLIEALACGCPVVSTNCQSGPREILRDGLYGHLTPVGDTLALGQAMQRSLDGDHRMPPQEWLDQFTPPASLAGYMHFLPGAAK